MQCSTRCSEGSRPPMEVKSDSCRLSRGLRRWMEAVAWEDLRRSWFGSLGCVQETTGLHFGGCLQSHWIGFRKDCTPKRGTLAIHVASNQVCSPKSRHIRRLVLLPPLESFRYSFPKIHQNPKVDHSYHLSVSALGTVVADFLKQLISELPVGAKETSTFFKKVPALL